VRLPPTAVVGDIVTVNLTPSTQAAAASSDTKAYSASQTLVQADIDARSVNIEFEQTPEQGNYQLEEKVTDSTGNIVKFSSVRDVSMTQTEAGTEGSKDSDGGSFGFGALFALLGLGLFRRRR
ncbi:GlyGly-CTERM sorting domain-containing protein, partial [Vibrio parahaemolyticus]|nr:GlyGly-CTERM sorting domain-containing protein [Vibrio parahaemolyticus]